MGSLFGWHWGPGDVPAGEQHCNSCDKTTPHHKQERTSEGHDDQGQAAWWHWWERSCDDCDHRHTDGAPRKTLK